VIHPAYFLDLPNAAAKSADALLLPLPYEATVTYGRGTKRAPAKIWRASAEVETWDEEIGVDLESIAVHNAVAVKHNVRDSVKGYLRRVRQMAEDLHQHRGLVIGVGGEHGLTPPLVFAAVGDDADLSDLTIVQFDAHADLRENYEGTSYSHACAMRRLVDRGANLLSIGVRSLCKEEAQFADQNDRIEVFAAQQLASDVEAEQKLHQKLLALSGKVYLTIDIDVLELHLCPGTGTPQPGGLSWWSLLRYLKTLLRENRQCELIGADLVEAAPMPGTHVNEFVAARLLAKMLAYRSAVD
jgi:agmatinase